MRGVTVICTSCNRPDLLEKTISSFLKTNTYPDIVDFLFHNDNQDTMDKVIGIQNATKNNVWFRSGKQIAFYNSFERLGLSRSLDYLLSMVKTEYFFNLEDDWIFEGNGDFISESMKIMRVDKSVNQVWIRDHDDHKHPLSEPFEIAGVKVREVTHGYLQHWNGFSFNPSLRRMSDYHRMFPNGFSEFKEEIECAKHVQKFNYKAVALEESVIKHIGWGRHTENFKH